MAFDAANAINNWRQTNNSFLNMIQSGLLQQHLTITDQQNKLNIQEIAQANLNTRYSALLCEQIQLKAELEETRMALKRVQNEKDELKSFYEDLHLQKIEQVGLAVQSIFQTCKETSAKLDMTNQVLQTVVSDKTYPAVLQANSGDDRQETVSDPAEEDVKTLTKCPVTENEKQQSIRIEGLEENVKLIDLKNYFSKYGTVVKVIMAESEDEIDILFGKPSSGNSTQLQSSATTKPAEETKLSNQYLTVDEQQRTILLSGRIEESELASQKQLLHYFAQYEIVVNVSTPTCVIFDTIEACRKCLKSHENIIWKGDPLVKQFVGVRPFIDEQDLDHKECTQLTPQNTISQTDDNFTCQLCQSEQSVKSRFVFNPCGHGACGKCAAQMEKCHICSNAIESKMKQFE